MGDAETVPGVNVEGTGDFYFSDHPSREILGAMGH
jgi:hypothetical protein